jgi:hypothetical protein
LTWEKVLKERAANFCWMLSSFLASIFVLEFQTTELYSRVDLTRIKYNIYAFEG